MRTFFAVSAIALAIVGVSGQSIDDDAWVKQKFTEWIHKYDRMYETEEFNSRYSAFKENLARVEYMNTMNINRRSGAAYELGPFADLSADEFKKTYLSRRVSESEVASIQSRRMPNSYVKNTGDLPSHFDWRDKGGVVTAVKNQGQCGSCWAFSTTGNVEGQWALAGNNLTSLSESNLVDCDTKPPQAGCNGGLPSLAYQYIIGNNGIDTEASYPYVPMQEKCKFNPANVGAKIANWTALSQDEDEIAAFLYKNGPVSIGINAGWMQLYSHGVADPLFCNPKDIDHGVLLVGFGERKRLFGGVEKYWIIKNSWGLSAGMDGYAELIRGKAKCGINLMATSSCIDTKCASTN